ncbi:MAG: hypothetical protein ABI583_00925 [Betaproteobacteria bacterium]
MKRVDGNTAAISTQSPTQANLRVLRELVRRAASQVDSAHSEIGETRAILKDAVEQLMPAFTALRNGEIDDSLFDSPTADRIRAIRASGPAFSALQFQDISDQLLAHAQVRLLRLLAEVEAVAAALNNSHAEPSKTDNLMQVIATANDNLAALDISLVKPVGKAHLGTGDMEFF